MTVRMLDEETPAPRYPYQEPLERQDVRPIGPRELLYVETADGQTPTRVKTLCESVRTAAGPRQRVVATLGKLTGGDETRPAAGWEDLAHLLEGRPPAKQMRLGEKPPLSTTPPPAYSTGRRATAIAAAALRSCPRWGVTRRR